MSKSHKQVTVWRRCCCCCCCCCFVLFCVQQNKTTRVVKNESKTGGETSRFGKVSEGSNAAYSDHSLSLSPSLILTNYAIHLAGSTTRSTDIPALEVDKLLGSFIRLLPTCCATLKRAAKSLSNSLSFWTNCCIYAKLKSWPTGCRLKLRAQARIERKQ